MGQVPVRYGIVGNGRVAKHMRHYFELLRIPWFTWHRGSSDSIKPDSIKSSFETSEVLNLSDIILLAISDNAIEKFIEEHPSLNKKKLVHFSGSISTPLAFGAHPLMTFSKDLYDLDTYKNISFITDEKMNFKEVFPELPNLYFKIKDDMRPLYHALCVMSGNFTTILWERFFAQMERHFEIPREATSPYFERIFQNLREAKEGSVLTGPLKRGDVETLSKNLKALEGDPFQKVYQAFVTAYQETI